MDGNPDVHAKTIRETLARHHALIVTRYFVDCLELAVRLSQSGARVGISPRMQTRIDDYSVRLPAVRKSTTALIPRPGEMSFIFCLRLAMASRGL